MACGESEAKKFLVDEFTALTFFSTRSHALRGNADLGFDSHLKLGQYDET
jgi:hypothetical protein